MDASSQNEKMIHRLLYGDPSWEAHRYIRDNPVNRKSPRAIRRLSMAENRGSKPGSLVVQVSSFAAQVYAQLLLPLSTVREVFTLHASL